MTPVTEVFSMYFLTEFFCVPECPEPSWNWIHFTISLPQSMKWSGWTDVLWISDCYLQHTDSFSGISVAWLYMVLAAAGTIVLRSIFKGAKIRSCRDTSTACRKLPQQHALLPCTSSCYTATHFENSGWVSHSEEIIYFLPIFAGSIPCFIMTKVTQSDDLKIRDGCMTLD